MLGILVLSLLALGADPAPTSAPAASPGGSAAANPSTAKSKGSELVCTEEKPTGSHFPKRICMTRDQAEKAERDAKDDLATRNQGAKASFSPK